MSGESGRAEVLSAFNSSTADQDGPPPRHSPGDEPYAVWHPFIGLPDRAAQLTTERVGRHMPAIEAGDGIWVSDHAGRRYFNLFSAASVVGLGREEVAKACAEQIGRLGFYPLFAGALRPAQELAARLLSVAPRQFRMVFFSNDGSGAVETALKMARQHFVLKGQPQRQSFIGLSGAYHGASYGSLSLSDLGLHALFGPMVPQCFTVPAPHPYRPPLPIPAEGLSAACTQALQNQIHALGAETIAAVIVEPVQSLGGIIPLPPDYLARVREITRRHGILLIADEVTTGFGRLGGWFGGSLWPIEADIMAVAKGLTGGYFPMGATLATEEVYDAFAGVGFPHGWTTSGHPVGCAAALSVLDILEQERLPENAATVGAFLLPRLQESLSWHPHVGEIRGMGLMIGVELVEDKAARTPPGAALVGSVTRRLREAGLLTAYVEGVISLYPPLILTQEQAGEIVSRMAQALAKVRSQGV